MESLLSGNLSLVIFFPLLGIPLIVLLSYIYKGSEAEMKIAALAVSLIDGVADFLHVHFGDDVEGGHGGDAILTGHGSVPEWPKGADCKSAGTAFGGSNPSRPTPNLRQ